MRRQESSENYLEQILILSKKQNEVRSIDIVNSMNFSKPSVSIAMKNLKQNECINVSEKGLITLTDKGLEIANKVYERHCVITQTLIQLGVPEDIAAEDACRIEHDLSEESFNAIKTYIKKLK
jgi:Mn-dependent DtxR family transcriptional regulator